MNINVQVKKGNYNLLDDEEVGWAVTLWFGENRMWLVLDEEPQWTVPSELVSIIADEMSRRLYFSNREDTMRLVNLFAENRDSYDIAWCSKMIAAHTKKIEEYSEIKRKIQDANT